MSNKKQSTFGNMSHPRDQHFQVSTLAENSSQDSSRKDNEHYQIRDFDASDEQEKQKKLIKSMQDLSTSPNNKDKLKETQITENVQNSIKETFKTQKIQQYELTPKNKQKKDQQHSNQTPLQKRKRKRQQIFQNLKRSNTKKQRIITSQQAHKINEKIKIKNTMNRIVFQKKRENHCLLKQWNYQRLKILQFHQKITQQLIKNIDKNVKLSLQNLQAYRSFMTQRCRQQQNYAKTIFANNQRFLQDDQILQQNSLSRNIYIACGSMYQAIARKDKRQKQLSLQFSNFIENKIIRQIFSAYFDKTHKQSLGLRNRIKTIKQTLLKIDQSICKKLILLQTDFTECSQNVNKQGNKDFYILQLSFLRKCESQMVMESRLGQEILDYLKFVIQQQEIRSQIIQKSLKLYIEAQKKYSQGIRKLSKSNTKSSKTIQESEDITIQKSGTQQMYKLQNLLQPSTLQQIKLKINKQNLIKVKENNLQSLNIQIINQKQDLRIELKQLSSIFKCYTKQFDSHHLVMKKFSVQVLKQNKWLPGQIIITVDKYIHIFVNALRRSGLLVFGGQNFYKPEATIKACFLHMEITSIRNQTDYIQSQQDLQLMISERIQQKGLSKLTSFLRQSKKIEQKIKFSTQNDLLQFQDYILQLSM